MNRLVFRVIAAMAVAAVLSPLAGEPALAQGEMVVAQNQQPQQQQRRDPISAFFRSLFGGGQRQQQMAPPPDPRYQQPQQRAPRAAGSAPPRQQRAAAPAEPEAVAKEPNARRVLVVGDFYAAGLEAGLVDAFGESAMVAVDGVHNASSGLVRDDFFDWPAAIEERLDASRTPGDAPAPVRAPVSSGGEATADGEELVEADAAEAPIDTTPRIDIAVIMIGANDRQALRDSAGEHAVRSERWRELYAERVDGIVALFLSRAIPVYWVGLPPVESGRLSQDYAYFNDLYRERAYRAGAEFVDIWNSFVDENGRYATHGPDVNGETRELRRDDGLHFTRAGNRKLAHFVARDIRRDIGRDGDLVVSLPQGPIGPQPFVPGEEEQETGIGEVMTLTGGQASASMLAGGGDPTPAPPDDSAYFRTILVGESPEPKPGRADDFSWPRGEDG